MSSCGGGMKTGAIKGAEPCFTKSLDCCEPRKAKSNIGPGPKTPAGAPPPSSKGSISYPKQVGR